MPIRIATAPVSWGILEFAGQSSQPPWEAVLDEMAAAGYTGTELGPYGYLPAEPEALRAVCNCSRLLCRCGWQIRRPMRPEQRQRGGSARCWRRAAAGTSSSRTTTPPIRTA